jgi:hypothetical protein
MVAEPFAAGVAVFIRGAVAFATGAVAFATGAVAFVAAVAFIPFVAILSSPLKIYTPDRIT